MEDELEINDAAEAVAGLHNVALVLMAPKYPENIGAAARIAMNMGISRLLVVRDEAPDREAMLKMATHKAAALIENMELHQDLATALADFTFVVGTTTRHGRQRSGVMDPREMALDLMPRLPDNRIALLFGPEHRGLTNEDLKFCHLLTTIPTADFSSLNLAQAIAICCYELFYCLKQQSGGHAPFTPKLAASRELEGMYEHMEQMLCRIGFLDTKDYDYWMRNIRRFFGRLGLRAKEVKMIRGFCRQFLWYDGQGKG